MKTTISTLWLLSISGYSGIKAFTPHHHTRTSTSINSNTHYYLRPSISLNTATTSEATNDIQTFVPPDVSGLGEISEVLCAEAASKMKSIQVPISSTVSTNTNSVGISYIHWEANKKAQRENGRALPLLLVHGFDSSCLEYRRLGPKLAERGIDVYAVDLLGWGYTQLSDVTSFSAASKIEALASFWNTISSSNTNANGNANANGNIDPKAQPVCVAGASLGGAAAIEFAASNPDTVQATIMIDAQGFVDGVGPMAFLPTPLAQLGVKVLKSVPLRSSANQMSYYNPDTYATDDALKVGRLHCLRDGWDDALVSFMKSGGFSPSEKVGKIMVPSLILWGRQDTILESEFAQKFVDTMGDAELQWIEECGHVPHLEQPEVTAEAISSFLRSDKLKNVELPQQESSSSLGSVLPTDLSPLLGVGGLAGVAALTATAASNF